MDDLNLGPETSRMPDGTDNNETTRIDILGLPRELVARILLKLCARNEATSRAVCKDFNNTTQTPSYRLTRQVHNMSDKQEPQYCGIFLSTDATGASSGWDPVAQEWVQLPSLAFLHNVHADNKCEKSEFSEVHGVWCSCNGLMCVKLKHRSNYYTYVCNPLTKSYLAIDVSQVSRSRMVMRAGDGESGFTMVAGVSDEKHTTLTLYKLESSNLAAGWRPLKPLPADVWAPMYTADLVLVGGIVRLVCVDRTDQDYRLMSLDMEGELWSSHPVIISGHGSAESPLSSRHDYEVYTELKLLQVGGSVWLVQMRQQRAFLKKYRSTGKVGTMTSEVSISRYEPEGKKFILEETRQIPLGGVVLGNGCTSMICIVDNNRLPLMYDVCKKRWFKSHRRVFGPHGGFSRSRYFRFINFPFQLSHASVT